MANKRVLWADNLKGFLILLVVAGHVLQSAIDTHINGIYMKEIFNWIYSFHMPLFFLISGFVYSLTLRKILMCDDFWKKWRRRIYTLTYLYFCYSFLMWVVKYFFLHRAVKESVDLMTLVLLPLYPISVYWFLYLLLGFFLIIPIIEKEIGLINYSCLFIFIVIQCVSIHVELPFYLNRFFYMLPFFLVGMFTCKFVYMNKLAVISTFMLVLMYIYEIQFPHATPEWALIRSYLWCIVFIIIFNKYLNYDSTILTNAGQQCLAIYLFHPYGVAGLKLLLVKLGVLGWMYVCLNLTMSLLISYLIAEMTKTTILKRWLYSPIN